MASGAAASGAARLRDATSPASTTSRPTIARAIAAGLVPAVGKRATVRPARMTVIVSEISVTSSSLCVMRMIVPPSSRRARSTRHSSSTSGGESTAVGSSRMRMRAPRTSVFRISTRCCSPTLSSRTYRRTFMRKPLRSAASLHVALRTRHVDREPARGLAPEDDVLRDGERGNEHEMLVHHPDARVDRLRGAPAGDIAAEHFDRARIGRIDAREDAHQRRLAGAILADQRVDLALHHLERCVAHRLAIAEALRDARHAHGERAGTPASSSRGRHGDATRDDLARGSARRARARCPG